MWNVGEIINTLDCFFLIIFFCILEFKLFFILFFGLYLYNRIIDLSTVLFILMFPYFCLLRCQD